jgi:FAD/FMN-containing dehydrogenase
MIDVSKLNRVIKINKRTKTAIVEPNVPMDSLVRATLAAGLLPPVVMEFPGITVGGGLQGGAGESSSFKFGTFNRTLNWYEMILADGERITASPSEYRDLYWGGAGAYGSLGVVTAAEVQLIPAKQFVDLEYVPVGSFAEAVEVTNSRANLHTQPYDYIDGIMFSRSSGVIMCGRLTDKPSAAVQTFSKRTDPWFYMHARQVITDRRTHTVSIPITDYLFRYDRGAFWMGEYAFRRFKTPFNTATRWLLDPLMHTRKMYDALQASGLSEQCVIQDLAIPAERTVQFLQYVDKTFAAYPLWLCPLAAETKSPLLSNNLHTKRIINVGVWTLYSRDYDDVVRVNRDLEKTLQRLGGKKWFYAYAYYTEKEFWKLYDKKWYDALRAKYHAGSLPTIYDKVRAKEPVKVSGKRGVLFALFGKNGIKISK